MINPINEKNEKRRAPSFESKAPRFEDDKKQSLDFSTPLRNLREVPSKNLQQHSQ
jgi:hypothetical protein